MNICSAERTNYNCGNLDNKSEGKEQDSRSNLKSAANETIGPGEPENLSICVFCSTLDCAYMNGMVLRKVK